MGKSKQVSSPFLTGGGGHIFENNVQTAFAILMLSGAFIPGMPTIPIQKIKLQGKYQGYETDDMIVYFESTSTTQQRKLLIQIKHSAHFTKSNSDFKDFIIAAWNDYNNPKVFEAHNGDRIALITGLLSFDDTRYMQDLLQSAKVATNFSDFELRITTAKFCSKKVKKIFDSIFDIIKSIDKGVSDEQIWEFLRILNHWTFDLDKRGVNYALLNSIISITTSDNPEQIWSEVRDEIQTKNQSAGIVSRETFKERILSKFNSGNCSIYPFALTERSIRKIQSEISQFQFLSEISFISLFGAWDEKCDADIKEIASIIECDYSKWINVVRGFSKESLETIEYTNGEWELLQPKEFWESSKQYLTSPVLQKFKSLCISVLRTRDSRLDSPKSLRVISTVGEFPIHYSKKLRSGIARSLAVIGCFPRIDPATSQDETSDMVRVLVSTLLHNSDWKLLATLTDVIGYLAEAAPEQFLSELEQILTSRNDQFAQLLAEEGEDLLGPNYLHGLINALEIVAWDRDYFGRTVLILAKMSDLSLKPSKADEVFRAVHSLFSPLIHHTNASLEGRRVTLQNLLKQYPDYGWKLLCSLLPNNKAFSFIPPAPQWREWANGLKGEKVLKDDYWNRINVYYECCLEYLRKNPTKHIDFIKQTESLTSIQRKEYFAILSELEGAKLDSAFVYELWSALCDLHLKHIHYSQSKWAFNKEEMSTLKELIDKFEPDDKIAKASRLFSKLNHELYSSNNIEDEDERIRKERQQAVVEILKNESFNGLERLILNSVYPYTIGYTVAITEQEIGISIIRKYLTSNSKEFHEFCKGFIRNKPFHAGWDWVDKTIAQLPDDDEKLKLFLYLPFCEETVNVIEKNPQYMTEYWENINVYPYEYEGSMDKPIERLLEVHRPYEALDCIHLQLFRGIGIKVEKVLRALKMFVEFQDSYQNVDPWKITKIIESIQSATDCSDDYKRDIEWQYLSLLDRNLGDVYPKYLEKGLAESPELFISMISRAYRSSLDNEETEVSEAQKAISTNAWRLLFQWRIPPGFNKDGSFDIEVCKQWISEVIRLADEKGYSDVVKIYIGQVLFFAPPDGTGFFINEGVAEILDALENINERRGFSSSAINSSGARWLPAPGSEEDQQPSEYAQRAEQAQAKGFDRLAATLREIDESFRNLHNR